jgi:hypothetical protein
MPPPSARTFGTARAMLSSNKPWVSGIQALVSRIAVARARTARPNGWLAVPEPAGRGTLARAALLALPLIACGHGFAQTINVMALSAPWTGATTNAAMVATFSEPLWPVNSPLAGNWTLNGVTYSGHAGTPFPNIFVISPSPLAGPALTANGDENIDLVLGPTRTAFAFDAAANHFGAVTVTVYDGTGATIGQAAIPAGTNGFFGCISSVPIARVNFLSVQGAIENSLLDNVRLADACLVVSQQPVGASACALGAATFSVAGAGPGPLTYHWSHGVTPIDLAANPSAATDTLSLTNLTSASAGAYSCVVANACGSVHSSPATLTVNSADFNGDGDEGTDADIEAFFACLGGNCCVTCGSADFNGDGDVGTDADIESFFRVLAGGPC